MTFEILNEIIEKHNIPKDVRLQSDSGCEWEATEMNGVWYNSKTNTIIFTQHGEKWDEYFDYDDWKLLHSDANQ